MCQALCSLRVGLQGCTLLTEEGNLGVPSAYGGLSIPSNPNVSPVTSGEVMTQRHDTHRAHSMFAYAARKAVKPRTSEQNRLIFVPWFDPCTFIVICQSLFIS